MRGWYVGPHPGDHGRRGTLTQPLGEIVARGTRSTVHAYGRGAVVKVPAASTPEDWIRYEARYAPPVVVGAALAQVAPEPASIAQGHRAQPIQLRIGGIVARYEDQLEPAVARALHEPVDAVRPVADAAHQRHQHQPRVT